MAGDLGYISEPKVVREPFATAPAVGRGKHLGEKEDGVTRVLIVDDHAFVRAQIVDMFADADGIEVVGECVTVSRCSRPLRPRRADVVLMDVRMPIKSGIDATRDLLAVAPAIRVLILTGSPTPGVVDQAGQVGASGLLLKGGDPQLLIQAVRTVAAGGTAWSIEPAVAQRPSR